MSAHIESLKVRIEKLKEEHAKGVQNHSMLSEQLQKLQGQVHMLIGHLNEANYQLEEALKLENNDGGTLNEIQE